MHSREKMHMLPMQRNKRNGEKCKARWFGSASQWQHHGTKGTEVHVGGHGVNAFEKKKHIQETNATS